MGETDDLISKKANILLSNDIKPIICVGEKERDSDSTHLGFISQQISKSLFLIDTRHISSIIIAYEPIWAVGAPEPMKTTEICETTIFIKKILSDLMGQEKAIKIPILYGGAVNKINAKEIIKEGKVDGLLIGRESVDANNFIELIKSI
jgi:triosephosphate isomerase